MFKSIITEEKSLFLKEFRLFLRKLKDLIKHLLMAQDMLSMILEKLVVKPTVRPK
jgi:hypothetical protein